MNRTARAIRGVVAWTLFAAGCGYVGEPLPPSLGIPEQITDLSVLQRGDRLVARFAAPGATTDGVLLRRLARVELRVGAWREERFEVERWAAQARAIDNDVTAPGPATIEVAAREWLGQEVVVAARAWGRKGRAGAWSNLVVFRVAAPLERPAGLKAEAVAEGVRLMWEGPQGAAFRILRNGAELARAGSSPYVDPGAQYGKTYQYAVQAFVSNDGSLSESEISEAVSITPEDRFPPAVPAGLTGVVSLRSIELSWEPNAEPDLKGYYLYRSVESGPFERVGELLDTPAASDRGVEAGRRYRYAVSAVDQKGNESARSEPVEITVGEDVHALR